MLAGLSKRNTLWVTSSEDFFQCQAHFARFASALNGSVEFSARCLEERRRVYFVAWLLAVDGGDGVATLQAGLRSRTFRQDRHHPQPMSKAIEDEPAWLKTSGRSEFFVFSK
jgi:hypothetical protein